ncbi:hypothetical protein AT575_09410 [Streptococcus penaeicida]|uniref:UPF0246 protein AT575_09410 n=1 Tax=Streptococcus penaeicida TaxID=1765960 RepID=A0A2N8LA69_9STRE|nr:peroxide stress protein YaaA [Streptococcus penaeicida]PND47061.1 hypothetical protein AT575_09410 [Streptococcus penaeicida]
MLTYLIPSAKEMVIPNQEFPPSLPENSRAIIDQLASLTVEELAVAYKISPQAASKESDRIHAIHRDQAPTYPAYRLFNGLMYRHIERDNLTKKEEKYLINNTFITSSLYGIIPFDYPIAEHRLDFQTKVKVKQESLKSYWRPAYDQFLERKGPFISLLSSEFEDVFSPEKRQLWISVTFLEKKNGLLKSHSTISKKGRGDFLTAACKANCKTLKDLKKLEFSDFRFDDLESDTKHFVYIKKEA